MITKKSFVLHYPPVVNVSIDIRLLILSTSIYHENSSTLIRLLLNPQPQVSNPRVMSESVNSTKPTSAFGFNLQVPNFGNGFVELAMLTILMGPASAATLVLGNHGAAGLAWATMSAFGTGRVIGACLSGACAPWLREIMGLRSKLIDSCLGMELSSKANGNITNIIRSRYAAEGPLALSMDSREISKEVREFVSKP